MPTRKSKCVERSGGKLPALRNQNKLPLLVDKNESCISCLPVRVDSLCSSVTTLSVACLQMLHQHKHLRGEVVGAANLLLNLKTVNNWSKLAKNLVCLLVEFQLGGDQVGKISQRFWSIKDLRLSLAMKV